MHNINIYNKYNIINIKYTYNNYITNLHKNQYIKYKINNSIKYNIIKILKYNI